MKKLDHKWASPFTITKVISLAAIKLHLSAWEKNICPIVSISIVCPYIPDEIAEHLQPPQPGPVMVDDQEEYEVEEILDSRFRWGKLWYCYNLRKHGMIRDTADPLGTSRVSSVYERQDGGEGSKLNKCVGSPVSTSFVKWMPPPAEWAGYRHARLCELKFISRLGKLFCWP